MSLSAARPVALIVLDGWGYRDEIEGNAIRLARLHTGRPKILATYRSYHGATHGVIGLTGDPRRWGTEPHTIPGMFHRPFQHRQSLSAKGEDGGAVRLTQHVAPRFRCLDGIAGTKDGEVRNGPEGS